MQWWAHSHIHIHTRFSSLTVLLWTKGKKNTLQAWVGLAKHWVRWTNNKHLQHIESVEILRSGCSLAARFTDRSASISSPCLAISATSDHASAPSSPAPSDGSPPSFLTHSCRSLHTPSPRSPYLNPPFSFIGFSHSFLRYICLTRASAPCFTPVQREGGRNKKKHPTSLSRSLFRHVYPLSYRQPTLSTIQH